jgi:hypothetical protein
MCDIFIFSEHYTLESYYLLNSQCMCVEHYSSSPAECAAARRVHSIAFALTVSAPSSSPILFSSASHFLKKALKFSTSERGDREKGWVDLGSLRLVTCHVLHKHTVKEVSKKSRFLRWNGMCRERNGDEPDALHVVLASLHIDVYAPEVPSFWMRVDDALEQRLSPLGFTQLIFQLSKFGDGLEVCACESEQGASQ